MMNFLLIFLFPFFQAEQSGLLLVKVTNVQEHKGSIRMAVYNHEKSFPSETHSFRGGVLPLAPGIAHTLSCNNLPYGQYAVAVYQDLNNNGKMDKNGLGIPTEPYAFSNNVRVKWRSPKFGEAAFVFSDAKQELVLSLKRWSQY